MGGEPERERPPGEGDLELFPSGAGDRERDPPFLSSTSDRSSEGDLDFLNLLGRGDSDFDLDLFDLVSLSLERDLKESRYNLKTNHFIVKN